MTILTFDKIFFVPASAVISNRRISWAQKRKLAVNVCTGVCACVCVRKRESVCERYSMRACVWCVYMCVCVKKFVWLFVLIRVCLHSLERDSLSVYACLCVSMCWLVHVCVWDSERKCVCVFICLWEREREGGRGRERKGEGERGRGRVPVHLTFSSALEDKFAQSSFLDLSSDLSQRYSRLHKYRKWENIPTTETVTGYWFFQVLHHNNKEKFLSTYRNKLTPLQWCFKSQLPLAVYSCVYCGQFHKHFISTKALKMLKPKM